TSITSLFERRTHSARTSQTTRGRRKLATAFGAWRRNGRGLYAKPLYWPLVGHGRRGRLAVELHARAEIEEHQLTALLLPPQVRRVAAARERASGRVGGPARVRRGDVEIREDRAPALVRLACVVDARVEGRVEREVARRLRRLVVDPLLRHGRLRARDVAGRA